MEHLHPLHLATENAEHPQPVTERPWYLALIALLGFVLGATLIYVTDFEPPPQTYTVVP